MSTSDQDPLDKKLSNLYQQRKQQLQMPDKAKLVPPPEQHPKQKAFWSSRPVWGSTITACFIMVVSFYFMPNDAVPVANDLSDANNQRVYSADTGYEVQHQPSTLMSSDVTATTIAQQGAMAQSALQSESDAANRRAKQARQETQRMSRAEIAKVEIAEAQIAEALIAKRQVEPEMASADSAQGFSDELIVTAAAPRIQRKANDGAYAQKSTTNNPPPTIVRLLTDKEKGKYRQSLLLYGQDCHGKVIGIAPKWLIGIDDNQWAEVHYDNQGKINAVNHLKDYPGCDDGR